MSLLRFIILLLILQIGLSAEIRVIISKDSPLDSISMTQLRSLYYGRSREINGIYLKPTMYKDLPIHKDFCNNILSKSPSSIAKLWKKVVFTGKASMIKSFTSTEEKVQFLTHNPNYIGYINNKDIPDNMKVLKIE